MENRRLRLENRPSKARHAARYARQTLHQRDLSQPTRKAADTTASAAAGRDSAIYSKTKPDNPPAITFLFLAESARSAGR